MQGKIATRAGVQVTKAYYANSGTGHLMDMFAKSEPGQNIVITGTGVSQTKMREDAGSRVATTPASSPTARRRPTSAVTNTTDTPNTVDHIELSHVR